MSFSEQLKKARLKIGYTQQKVADLMEITKSTYCGYETGKRQPDVAKIKLLANILNTSGDVLLETGFESKTPYDSKDVSVATVALSVKEEKLIADFRELNSQGQDYILQTMDLVKDKYKKCDSVSELEEIG